MTSIKCGHCGGGTEKSNSAINRANKEARQLYCDMKCAGAARRKHKTSEQKVAEKRAYDEEYRSKNKSTLKVKKAAQFQASYDPEKARIKRKERSEEHNEYCRKPKYKLWKKEYDKKYRAKKYYGEFWECFLLSMNIRDECLTRQSAHDINIQKDTYNKSQRRKRNDNINSKQP